MRTAFKTKHILFHQRLGRWAQDALDFLLPPRCIATGETVAAHGTLSPAFWAQLTFIEEPCCARCGAPFTFQSSQGALCAPCMESPPVFDAARAALLYTDASRKLVVDFKYADKLHAVDTFAPWLLRAGAGLIAKADCLIPVPLHPRRLWARRYNQSALLAQAIGARAGKAVIEDGLLRLRHTPQQKGLSRAERLRNVKGAFAVNPRRLQNIAGARVLLIDDVLTTGATLNVCARALKDAHAATVDVLTLARVTQDAV